MYYPEAKALHVLVPGPSSTDRNHWRAYGAGRQGRLQRPRNPSADELARCHFMAAAREDIPLSSLARFVNGKAFTKGATGTGRVVVRIAELNSGLGGSTVYNDLDVSDDHFAGVRATYSSLGRYLRSRWYRPEAIVNQHIFKVIPNDGRPMWLVNQAVHAKLDEFKAIAADKATTMGHISRGHLDQPVRIPDTEATQRLRRAHDRTVGPSAGSRA